jgi:hypothetical protein
VKAGGKHKMEAICSSEMSVDTQWTTQRYIPEYGNFHNHRCENLKSYEQVLVSALRTGHFLRAVVKTGAYSGLSIGLSAWDD